MRLTTSCICLLLHISLIAQTGTIKVKKATNCVFTLIADTTLINKEFEIGAITMSGLIHYDNYKVLTESNLYISQNMTIRYDSLESHVKAICNSPFYKLVSVAVNKPPSQNSIFLKLDFLEK